VRSPRQRAPFDVTGQVTTVLAMGALTYGVIEAGTDGFVAPRVLIAPAVAVAALAAFLAAGLVIFCDNQTVRTDHLPRLDGLEDAEWVTARWEDCNPDLSKPRRRFYRLTPTGLAQARPTRTPPGMCGKGITATPT
jgi:hypothetical protein